MRASIATLCAVACVCVSCAGGAFDSDAEWRALKQRIERRFPDAPGMPVDALVARLDGAGATNTLLLDARAPEEYAVSHLPGARLTQGYDEAVAALRAAGTGATAVVYCSVGYRSADLVSQLRSNGWTNTVNLTGSLFEWANEGHPVFRGTNPVHSVHPYDRTWGRLLNSVLWPESWARPE